MRALLFCLALAMPCGAAISLVAHTGAAAGSLSASITTSAINTTGATFLAASVATYNAAQPATLTDNFSNTWIKALSRDQDSVTETIYYAAGATVGASHTFTLAVAGVTAASIAVAAFSGVAVSSPLSSWISSTTGAWPTFITCPAITPPQDDELVITGIAFENPSSLTAPDSGFTITDVVNMVGGTSYGTGMAYLVQGTAFAVNPTWTFSASQAAAVEINAVFAPGSVSVTSSAAKRRIFN